MPPVFSEEHVFHYFRNKLNRNISGFKVINQELISAACLISTQSATDLAAIPSQTIDYIFTDPPYANKVQYGELNFVWEAWLGFDTHWHDLEIIVNETRGITEADWARLMRPGDG